MGWNYTPDPPQYPAYPPYAPQPGANPIKEAQQWLKFVQKMEKKKEAKKKEEKKEEPFFFMGFKCERMNKKKESKISPQMMVVILIALGPFVGMLETWVENALKIPH